MFDRSVALADSNQGSAGLGTADILARLNYGQGQLFTRLAQENRFFYLLSASVASSAAASQRTLDLSTLDPPIERLMLDGVVLPGGTPLSVVDFTDQAAALAPRAYPAGLILHEIGSEWGATGIISFTVWYVSRPADLNVAGNLTQVLALPDRFASWYDYDLALFFSQRDTGRGLLDPEEFKRLGAYQEAVYQDIVQYLDHVMGPALRRFALPVSPPADKA